MTDPATSENVIDRLRLVQSQNRLSGAAQKTAEQLIGRLSSPVRVTVLGPRGAGKSTVRNLLAGGAVVPADNGLPTTELRFGETDRITATLGDRSVQDIAGLDFQALRALKPVFAEITSSLPRLKRISLLELVTDDAPQDTMAAIRWASKRTDIAIWVTVGFLPQEQALWAGVPDEIKDHGFLVLNQIDTLSDPDRDTLTARIKSQIAGDFHSFYPTVAVDGVAALVGKGAVPSTALGTSGCDALLNAVMHHVDLGTQADIDGALMFLKRFDPAGTKNSVPVAPPSGDARITGPEVSRATDPRPGAEELQTLQVESIFPVSGSSDRSTFRAAQERALEQIRSDATTMIQDIAGSDPGGAEAVLGRCSGTIEQLATTLAEDDPLAETVMQASDVIILLQLEKTESAAEDAIVAMLQLKREIEVAIAA